MMISAKKHIKLMILRDPSISVEDLQLRLQTKHGLHVSITTLEGIRSEFRHSLRLLQQQGLLTLDLNAPSSVPTNNGSKPNSSLKPRRGFVADILPRPRPQTVKPRRIPSGDPPPPRKRHKPDGWWPNG
jgi:hypothetical protein